MAITNGIVMKNMRGAINKEIVFKQYGDKTVASKYPDMSKVVRSEKQVINNLLMKAANSVAKSILSDEKKRNDAQLRLNVTSNKLYTALIREFYKNNKEEFSKMRIEVTARAKKKKKKR
jgi:hypothetical protein